MLTKKATGATNYSQCDSLLLGDRCGAHTFPYMDINNDTAIIEHEATTSKISEDQIFYCNQRGISTEDAIGLIVNTTATTDNNHFILHIQFIQISKSVRNRIYALIYNYL